MHEVLVNRLFKLAQEKVWLGELTVPVMTIAVDCDVQQQQKKHWHSEIPKYGFPMLYIEPVEGL